jgi:hypothetical protein
MALVCPVYAWFPCGLCWMRFIKYKLSKQMIGSLLCLL